MADRFDLENLPSVTPSRSFSNMKGSSFGATANRHSDCANLRALILREFDGHSVRLWTCLGRQAPRLCRLAVPLDLSDAPGPEPRNAFRTVTAALTRLAQLSAAICRNHRKDRRKCRRARLLGR